MKNSIIILLILLSTTGIILAQHSPRAFTARPTFEKSTFFMRMLMRLDLTEEQKTAIQEYRRESANERIDLEAEIKKLNIARRDLFYQHNYQELKHTIDLIYQKKANLEKNRIDLISRIMDLLHDDQKAQLREKRDFGYDDDDVSHPKIDVQKRGHQRSRK